MELCARIRVSFLLLLAFSGAFCSIAPARAVPEKKISPGDQQQLTEFVTLLQKEKNRSEDYVLRAKQIKEEEYRKEAHRLYDQAEIDFNHYLTEIFNAVRLGSHPDLKDSSKLAHDSAATFESYVEAHTQTKSPTVIIAGAKTVLEMGMNILNWFSPSAATRKSQIDKMRRETADYWQPRLEWKSWDTISAGG